MSAPREREREKDGTITTANREREQECLVCRVDVDICYRLCCVSCVAIFVVAIVSFLLACAGGYVAISVLCTGLYVLVLWCTFC